MKCRVLGGISHPASSALFVTSLANLIDPLLNYFFAPFFVWTGHTDKLFDHKPWLLAKSHFGSLWLMIQPFVLRKVSRVSTNLQPLLFWSQIGKDTKKAKEKHALNAGIADEQKRDKCVLIQIPELWYRWRWLKFLQQNVSTLILTYALPEWRTSLDVKGISRFA